MNKGVTATLVILIIVGAGIAVFFYIGLPEPKPSEPELNLTNSDEQTYVIINEFKPSSDVLEEFVELFVHNAPQTLENWTLTTYDGELVNIPEITSLRSNSYIRIITGNGASDVDLGDGQATIFAHLNESILDLAGDEIGLHDANGSLVSFVRYNNGNGDDVPTALLNDINIALPGIDSSISFFREDFPRGLWLQTPATAGEPNIASFSTSGKFGGEEVWIINGARNDLQYEGIDDVAALGETINVTASAGVNATVIGLIHEHINFSLNLYRQLGFGTPQTDSNNRIIIRVVNSSANDTTGSTSSNGTIVLRIGQRATREELKLVGEHELMHTFQFKRYNDSTNATYRHIWFTSRWFIEGQAEFFGMWSMLKNYPNMTLDSWMDMASRIGGLNWHDHYRNLNESSPFGEWIGTWNDYMGSYLFMKWLNETYGFNTLLQIFNHTRYYGFGDARNVSPEDAIRQVLNMTLADLVIRFWSWLILNANRANGVPSYTEPHVRMNYTDTPLNDTAAVRGRGGAIIEEIEMHGESPFTIRLNYTHADNTWVASVLVFYEDGTNETILIPINRTSHVGEIHIDPKNPKRIARIWIVKGVLSRYTEKITMRIIPDHERVVNMTYTGTGLNDTVSLGPGESAYEVIYINNSTSFSLFLNWTGGNRTHLNFTIIRFWSDGSNDTFRVEYVNETWRGYVLDPDAGPVTVTKLVIIKENLNETAINITMTVTPQNETPWNAGDPIIPNDPWDLWGPPYDQYWNPFGGFLQGYIFLDSTRGYTFAGEVYGGDVFGYMLAANHSVVLEFQFTSSSTTFQMLAPTTGIYYVVFYAGEGILDSLFVTSFII